MKSKIQSLVLVFMLAFFSIALGCSSDASNKVNETNTKMTNNQPNINESAIAKVKVTQKDEIFLNGKQISLDEFKKSLAAIKGKNGGVYYYRENPQGEPNPLATSVIQAIIDAKLPVRLSTKPDFSDFVDLEGKANS